MNSLGNGVVATISTLYFLCFAGLSVAQIPMSCVQAFVFYSTAFSAAAVLGPLVSTAIVLAYGWSGWAVLAVAFLVAGVVASRAAPGTEA